MFKFTIYRYMLCFFLIPSMAFCASGVSDKKSCDGVLEHCEFQLTQDKEKSDFNITIYSTKVSREIGDIDFVIELSQRMRINLIRINELFQRKGLGSILMQLAIKIAHDYGCQEIELRAEPLASAPGEYQSDLKRLVEWYNRFGFIFKKEGSTLMSKKMAAATPFILDAVPTPEFSKIEDI